MKKLLIIAGVLVGLTALIVLLVYRAPIQEKYIRYQIDAANYCQEARDCSRVEGNCPFGCNIYVNNSEADRIEELIQNTPRECEYRCPAADQVVCEANKCQAIYY